LNKSEITVTNNYRHQAGSDQSR